MRSLFLVFANICLLRRGPELVPTQSWFVLTVAVADLLTSFVVSNQLSGTLTPVALATSLIVTMATTAAITWIALYLRGLDVRFPATITAIFGCDLLFTVVVAVMATAIGGVGSSNIATGLVAAVGIWSIAVNGFILHRAIEVNVMLGVVIAFGMAMIGFVLSGAAVGPPATP
jgi:hypothetical protein